MDAAARSLVERSADLLEALRARAPLVQCITNTVVQTVTANTLLALGASPAMVDVPTEAGPFAHAADALLVNTGTPHAEQRTGALEAATAAAGSGTPWVLDPVAIGALPVRTALARRLLALRPTVVRGNASEVIALTGGSGGRGTDSTAVPEDAVASSLDLAGRLGVTSAVSGPVDVVVGSRSIVRIANGTPMLTRVTGGGCALGAVTAAFLAVAGAVHGAASTGVASSDRVPTSDLVVTATAAATIAYTVAAEAAAARSAGPGSFSPALLDALAALTPEDVRRDARVTVTRVPAGSVAGTAA